MKIITNIIGMNLLFCNIFNKRAASFTPLRILTQNIREIHTFNSKKNGNEFNERSLSPTYLPKTENQKEYVNYLSDTNNKIILAVGEAGTGKTLFACIRAIKEYQAGTIEKIVLTRPIVPVEEEELGFLPGDIIKKMAPWTLPVFDIFSEFYSKQDLEAMLRAGVIEISPLAYMRGRTFKRSFIIADEMQNSSPNQMMMLLTRIGDKSRMVITGDLKQTDKGTENGLRDFMGKVRQYNKREQLKTVIETKLNETEAQPKPQLKSQNEIKIVELNTGDVERSPIVSKIIDIYSQTASPTTSTSSTQNGQKEYSSTGNIKINNQPNSDCAMIPKSQQESIKKRFNDIKDL